MRGVARIWSHSTASKVLAAALIALVSAVVLTGARYAPGASQAVGALDELFYDLCFQLRTPQDMTQGNVVIVAVDQKSLEVIDKNMQFGWPWPRDFWGLMVDYLNVAGARVVAFDILFTETSVHAREVDDDNTFAAKIGESKLPVVLAAMIDKDGKPGRLGPPVEKPIFGAVNLAGAEVFRTYRPFVNGHASLAGRAVEVSGLNASAGESKSDQHKFDEPFLMHYYGPHEHSGERTFRYVSAANVIQAGMGHAKEAGITPEMFKGKIVLIGALAAVLSDVKRSPFGRDYPGVEFHATAIENMLRGQRVRELGVMSIGLSALGASFIAAVAVLFPRKATVKVAGGFAAMLLLAVLAGALFLNANIIWLPLASPLIALVVATVGAFGYAYLTEDRQRRFVVKALGQYVSPEVAQQISANPESLKLGGERREMTVMFTDIAGFTDLSEGMPVEKLNEMLNFYLDEMSAEVLKQDGTLDKYIGDAIMSFWNAPADQPDHAARAVLAALAMVEAEARMQPRLAELGAANLMTRLGVNTGWMAVGNMGSSRKFNYTVMGDPVNLGSRLEGANKLYGSRILISQTTATMIDGKFLMRQLDVLKVKGKTIPMPVFEVLSEGQGTPELRERVEQYNAAYQAYRKQRWDEAEMILGRLVERYADDKPARALLKRIESMRAHPPGEGWDGVYEAKEK